MSEQSLLEIIQERTQNENLQTPSEIEAVCCDCKKKFLSEVWLFCDERRPVDNWCAACGIIRELNAEQAKQERLAKEQRLAEEARKVRFESEVPPLFRATPPELIDPILLNAADSWAYSPKGLGFIGETGTGKTSAIVRVLERMSKEGKYICLITATELSELSATANQYDDEKKREKANQRLKHAKSSDIMFLDDLGKGKLTERGESTLFDLVDHRYSHQLPVFWTSNSSSEAMLKKLSPDRGLALVRRLTDTSIIISQYTV
jgi:DNA replication protein DnaC